MGFVPMTATGSSGWIADGLWWAGGLWVGAGRAWVRMTGNELSKGI